MSNFLSQVLNFQLWKQLAHLLKKKGADLNRLKREKGTIGIWCKCNIDFFYFSIGIWGFCWFFSLYFWLNCEMTIEYFILNSFTRFPYLTTSFLTPSVHLTDDWCWVQWTRTNTLHLEIWRRGGLFWINCLGLLQNSISLNKHINKIFPQRWFAFLTLFFSRFSCSTTTVK